MVEGQGDNIDLSPEELTKAKVFLEGLIDFQCTSAIEIDLFTAAVICIATNELSGTK